MKSVNGKNVLITGGAKGMGRLFAERVIAEQASAVVLWDVDESALNDTLTELADRHSEVSGYIVDVSDAAAVADTAAAVLGDLGRIDVLVNNAGVVRGNQYFWETELERDTKFTIDVNTLAPMYVAHEFLPQ
jgi:all-trans-retinol dehydrogenase (NAD+)